MTQPQPPSTPTFFTVSQALQQAIAHHKAGQLQDAERLYRAVLQVQPRHPDANHNLGVLAVGVGKPELGLPYLKTALEVNPAYGQYWLSYIEALLAGGKGQDAQLALEQGKLQGLSDATTIDALMARIKEKCRISTAIPDSSHSLASPPMNRHKRRNTKSQGKAAGLLAGSKKTKKSTDRVSVPFRVSELSAGAILHHQAGRLAEAE